MRQSLHCNKYGLEKSLNCKSSSWSADQSLRPIWRPEYHSRRFPVGPEMIAPRHGQVGQRRQASRPHQESRPVTSLSEKAIPGTSRPDRVFGGLASVLTHLRPTFFRNAFHSPYSILETQLPGETRKPTRSARAATLEAHQYPESLGRSKKLDEKRRVAVPKSVWRVCPPVFSPRSVPTNSGIHQVRCKRLLGRVWKRSMTSFWRGLYALQFQQFYRCRGS